MVLGLLTDKTYSLNNAWARQLPAQYIYVIIHYRIGYNIVDIANQLFFTYQRIAFKIRVLVILSTKAIKVLDFICALEKKQKV